MAFRSRSIDSKEVSTRATGLLNRFYTSRMRLLHLWVTCTSNLRYRGNHQSPKKRQIRSFPSMEKKLKGRSSALFMLKITRLPHSGLRQKIKTARITLLWSILWVDQQPSIRARRIQAYMRKSNQEFRNFLGQSRHLKWVWNLKAEVKSTAFSISPRSTRTQGSRINPDERVWTKTAVATWEMRHQAVSRMSQTPR